MHNAGATEVSVNLLSLLIPNSHYSKNKFSERSKGMHIKAKSRKAILFVEWILLISASEFIYGFDENNSQHEVYAVRTSANIKIDGLITPEEWSHAKQVGHFIQKEPSEGQPVSEKTIVSLLYNEKGIYFAIQCFDQTPGGIVANEMRRDHSLADNDYFEILIDTFHDKRNAYYFATNALGARRDCQVKNEGDNLNWNWDGVWSCAATLNSTGWNAEIEIPFQTLQFDKENELVWGINFGRSIARKREEAFWAPISRDDDFDYYGKYRPTNFGLLRGLSFIAHDSKFQVKPYLIGGMANNLDSNENRLFDAGFDLKLNLTSNITSDITVNTDFAQVEADEEQVNIGRFNLFVPEKRDFFLEGLGSFKIGEGSASNPSTLLFFSRKVGADSSGNRETPILGGVKITGKEGPNEISFLNVHTNSLEHVNSPDYMPQINYTAARVKRDVFKRSSVGLMFLNKQATRNAYNRTLALDADFALDNNITVSGYLAKTLTPGLKDRDFNSYLRVEWGTDKYRAATSFSEIGVNFNPEMGFFQWKDVRKYAGFLQYSPRPKLFNIRRTFIRLNAQRITDRNSVLKYQTIQPSLYLQNHDDSYIYLTLNSVFDIISSNGSQLGKINKKATILPGTYRYDVVGFIYQTDTSKKRSWKFRVAHGSFFDGRFSGITLSGAWNPTNKLGGSLSWQYNNVNIPFENGAFAGSLARLQFKYSFTPDLFLKGDLQWNELDNLLTSNIHFNYIHHKGSDFFLVFSDRWDTHPALGSRNRALISKVTYLFDL